MLKRVSLELIVYHIKYVIFLIKFNKINFCIFLKIRLVGIPHDLLRVLCLAFVGEIHEMNVVSSSLSYSIYFWIFLSLLIVFDFMFLAMTRTASH